ncbi:DUF1828 domain-containing protein [Variovorax sp. NFACC27]|uniref:DUF1828 domain-containing protein n=1 Tax=unclassified Variovorax TaxID=663243 RepID=UPI0015A3522C
MINCVWAHTLSRYDCREVKDLHGGTALEIATPFSLIDGSPIVLYIAEESQQLLISDNGDTVMHLSGLGLDIDHGARLNKLREVVSPFGLTLSRVGDFRTLVQPERAPFSFAQAVSGLLAVSQWANAQMNEKQPGHDLAAEAEPFIIARNPNAYFQRHAQVSGASGSVHEFAFRHGSDLIDVIPPKATSCGTALRKAGDVQNGPAGMDLHPLVIVDDRAFPDRAQHEIGILGAFTRAMPMTRLMAPLH